MRSARTSCTSGMLTIAFSAWLNPPPLLSDGSTSALASNLAGFGAFGTSLIVPPIEPEPYRVPCGPRMTSTRAMSYRLGSITTLPFWAFAGAVSGVSSR